MSVAYDYNRYIDTIALEKEIVSRGYRHFIELAWPLVEPSQPFSHNWHIDAVADHLEAAFRGDIKRLVINVPPGTTKSLSGCVCFPAWFWTEEPGFRSIFGSYSEKLAMRDSIRCRNLIESDWYQARWGDKVIPKKEDSWTATRFVNRAGGSRMITTPEGGITGEHAHLHLVDDPSKPFEATGSLSISEKAQEKVDRWWGSTMTTRAVDITKLVRIVMMQRLAGNDLAGKMTEEGYEVLCLPMRHDTSRICKTSIGFVDPRKEEGELLDPIRFPDRELSLTEKELGPRATAAQLQQDPAPSEGVLFKDHHFRNRYYKPLELFGAHYIQSWDCTFNETGDSFVCGLVWAECKGKFYLLDRVKERLTFTKTIRAINVLTSIWPQTINKLIEKKANGDAIIDTLTGEISGLVPITPTESKYARANAIEPEFEYGNVWLPSEELSPWVIDYEKEMKKFTGEKGEKNDQVDATTQALLFFTKGKNMKVKKALENIAQVNNYV